MELLLAIDIGNTNTVIGCFNREDLVARWRISSRRETTADESMAQLQGLLAIEGLRPDDVTGLAISSVVPPITDTYRELASYYLGIEPLIVDSSTPTGLTITYSRPHELGADRIVNAVAAHALYNSGVIVVDYGTATTFDCVSDRGDYMGGAIAPGLASATEALASRTAMLPRISLREPPSQAIGRDTVSAMRSGLLFGFAGMTQGILERICQEYPSKPRIIATGGLAPALAPLCESIEEVVPDLTLEGLAIIYRLNR